MKLSTLVMIEEMFSSRDRELEQQIVQMREARDSRMSELGISDWDDRDDPVLLDICTHLQALRDLLSDHRSAYNDWKGVDWS